MSTEVFEVKAETIKVKTPGGEFSLEIPPYGKMKAIRKEVSAADPKDVLPLVEAYLVKAGLPQTEIDMYFTEEHIINLWGRLNGKKK